jgi:Patatin phospholipase
MNPKTGDVDFSPSGIRQRWDAGYANTQCAIEPAPWEGEFDPLEGVILHEPRADTKIVQVDGNLNPVAKPDPELRSSTPVLRAG